MGKWLSIKANFIRKSGLGIGMLGLFVLVEGLRDYWKLPIR